MIRILLSFIFLAVSASAFSQQLYKWVDKDGKVQYSDQPPPASAKQEKLDVKVTPPAAPPASGKGDEKSGKGEAKATGPKSLAERDLEFKQRRIKEEEEAAKRAAETKQNQDKCNQARSQLKGYQETGRIFSYDAKGERVYADDQTRQREMEKAQQDISTYCK